MESAISSFGLACDRVFEDPLDAGLGQRLQAVQRQAQAHRATGDLGQRFLAGHVQRRQGGGHLRQRLQQQGRLADAGIAADQHHRALGQAAAEHAIELADAGRRACVFGVSDIGQCDHLRHIDLARPAAASRGRRCRLRRAFQHDFAQRVPRPAGLALALPLGVVCAALGAHVCAAALLRGGLGGGFGHRCKADGDAAL
jgi:hypothetical protein